MRGVWTVFMILGVVVFGGAAVLLAYMVLSGNAGGVNPRLLVWSAFLTPLAGACGAGLFMSAREFQDAMKPETEDTPPPAWLQQMQDSANSKRDD
jgi:hypothetical protein